MLLAAGLCLVFLDVPAFVSVFCASSSLVLAHLREVDKKRTESCGALRFMSDVGDVGHVRGCKSLVPDFKTVSRSIIPGKSRHVSAAESSFSI